MSKHPDVILRAASTSASFLTRAARQADTGNLLLNKFFLSPKGDSYWATDLWNFFVSPVLEWQLFDGITFEMVGEIIFRISFAL